MAVRRVAVPCRQALSAHTARVVTQVTGAGPLACRTQASLPNNKLDIVKCSLHWNSKVLDHPLYPMQYKYLKGDLDLMYSFKKCDFSRKKHFIKLRALRWGYRLPVCDNQDFVVVA